MRIVFSILVTIFMLGLSTRESFAQSSQSVLYIPLIGVTSVPDPLALPKGAGNVTYNYAVKNFLREDALTDVQVTDDVCGMVIFTEGDDDGDSKLDYDETWRYTCTTKLSETTQSVVTAMGQSGSIAATHHAYATVVVGSDILPPLVSVINITKVAYPLSLPAEGGEITFTYKVNNPGVVPLSTVKIIDDKCTAMSNKLGDTNGNNLLDVNEVWIYTCNMHLTQTTTNKVQVTAVANGLRAVASTSITVKVQTPLAQAAPGFPYAGGGEPNLKIKIWEVLGGVLGVMVIVLVLKNKFGKKPKKYRLSR